MSGEIWIHDAANATADGYTGATALGKLAETVSNPGTGIVEQLFTAPDAIFSLHIV